MGDQGGGGKRDGGGGSGGGGGRKKARFQRHGPGPSGGGHAVPQGARGLLVTCDAGRERRCGDEISALCEAAFERLGSSEAATTTTTAAGPAGGGDTIDARLAAEVATLRDKRKDRFRFFDTGVRGVFFLAFPSAFREPGAPGPVAVATDLVERARREGRSGSRFAQRLVPVERSCFGGLEELAGMALDVAKEHFGAVLVEGEEEEKKEKEEGGEAKDDAPAAAAADAEKKEEDKAEAKEEKKEEDKKTEEEDKKTEEEDKNAEEDKKEDKEDDDKNALPKKPNTTAQPGTKPLTFAVDVDSRACGRITRAAAIEVTAAPVPCPPHKVDLTNPDVTIVVQCVRNAATAAVVPRFRELLRLNLARAAQLGADEIEAREAAEGAAAGGAKEEEAGKKDEKAEAEAEAAPPAAATAAAE
jgi:hypothetical protein